MMAQRSTEELVAEIERLYLALSKTNHSAVETARTINSILLHEGSTKHELDRAWDKWFAVRNGRIEER